MCEPTHPCTARWSLNHWIAAEAVVALSDARWGQQKNAQLNITPNCRPTNCEQIRHLFGALSKLGGCLFCSKSLSEALGPTASCPPGCRSHRGQSSPRGACCLSGPTTPPCPLISLSTGAICSPSDTGRLCRTWSLTGSLPCSTTPVAPRALPSHYIAAHPHWPQLQGPHCSPHNSKAPPLPQGLHELFPQPQGLLSQSALSLTPGHPLNWSITQSLPVIPKSRFLSYQFDLHSTLLS